MIIQRFMLAEAFIGPGKALPKQLATNSERAEEGRYEKTAQGAGGALVGSFAGRELARWRFGSELEFFKFGPARVSERCRPPGRLKPDPERLSGLLAPCTR